AYVFSSGKNMGAFKGVGNPRDIAEFFRIGDYEGYIWTAHTRFPTNTPGWWGGAHPFTLLDWSIVHNGEISSYGINKRYLEMYGYKLSLLTDTEAAAYMLDLLIRRHGLDVSVACMVLAAPFWKKIDSQGEAERDALAALRLTYGSALLNGPFSILFGHGKGLVGINDRIKLRPLVAAVKDDMVYMASEESAIREICPSPDKVWAPRAGEPVIVELD
ncbi:MAG: glutamine amidotransferase family protein, partial [Deltaproteobacteria bacterium]|nr:glutamine amidotransferase family protein [Deltaproteobacteria bacterium]